jgi:DNA ligase-1
MITKPLLAATWNNEKLVFPLYATPKIDGIRVLKQNGKLISRSFKDIKNIDIKNKLTSILPEGCDGEIFIKDKTISDVTSLVNSRDKLIGNEKVQYFVFDMVTDNQTQGYLERIKAFPQEQTVCGINIIPLVPVKINSLDELLAYENVCLDSGYEGIMLRKGDGVYKCGRSTIKECILVKVKRFTDMEAKIINCEPLYHNDNGVQINELGENFRSSHKENKIKSNTLGAFIVESLFDQKHVQFKIGSGFTNEQRVYYWNTRDTLINKTVKFKYFQVGSKYVPRHPIFLSLRDPDDM